MKQVQFYKTLNLGVLLVAIIVGSGCSSIWSGKPCKPDSDAVYIKLDNLKKDKKFGNCGELAVNQVISHFGKSDAQNKKGLNFARFNDTLSLVRYARANGLKCKLDKVDLVQIIDDVKKNKPVLVFVTVNSSSGKYTLDKYITHCIVVCGYQKKKEDIIFYSDGDGPFKISSKDFKKECNKTGQIAIRFENNKYNQEGI